MNFDSSQLIIGLFLVTAVLAVLFGVWQYRKVQKAKASNAHSALADVKGDVRGAPPARRPATPNTPQTPPGVRR